MRSVEWLGAAPAFEPLLRKVPCYTNLAGALDVRALQDYFA